MYFCLALFSGRRNAKGVLAKHARSTSDYLLAAAVLGDSGCLKLDP